MLKISLMIEDYTREEIEFNVFGIRDSENAILGFGLFRAISVILSRGYNKEENRAARFYTKIDLKSGYHQIRWSSINKTGFPTPFRHFEWLVMPFWLSNRRIHFNNLWIRYSWIQ